MGGRRASFRAVPAPVLLCVSLLCALDVLLGDMLRKAAKQDVQSTQEWDTGVWWQDGPLCACRVPTNRS